MLSWYCSALRLPQTVTRSNLQAWDMQPHTIMEPPPNGICSRMFLWTYAVFVCLHTRALPSVIDKRNRLSSDQWTLRQFAKFQRLRAWHHPNRFCLCCLVRRGRLTGLLARYPAECSLFRTVPIIDICRRGSHILVRSVLFANGKRLTSLNNCLSSREAVHRGLADRGRSLTSPVADVSAANDYAWLVTIQSASNLPQWHASFPHTNGLPSFSFSQFWRSHSYF